MFSNMGYAINRGEVMFGPMPDGADVAYPTSELEWVSIQVQTLPDGSTYGTAAQLGYGGSLLEDLDGDGSLELVLTAPMLWRASIGVKPTIKMKTVPSHVASLNT